MPTCHIKCLERGSQYVFVSFSRQKHATKLSSSQCVCLDYNKQASNYPCRPTQLQYWLLSQKHKIVQSLGIVIFK